MCIYIHLFRRILVYFNFFFFFFSFFTSTPSWLAVSISFYHTKLKGAYHPSCVYYSIHNSPAAYESFLRFFAFCYSTMNCV